VGLGVDGSASNDAAHLVNEARQALLLARVGRAMQAPEEREGRTFFGCDLGPAEMTARDALDLATRGGAKVLGRQDIGQLSVGLCADLAIYDLNTLGFAGAAVHDPVGALLLCSSASTRHTIVNGKVVVRDGQLATLELGPLLERHNRLAVQLMQA
jgi:cytosine/adenosine deaminase-related metal-dependent hydrolase